jgi:hypothetical protein
MNTPKQTREKDLESILTITVGFAVIYLSTKNVVFLYIALSVGVLGLMSKFIGAKINWLWLKISEVLGMIMPKVILSAVFFLALVPIGLLSRLFGKKDNLQLKKTEGNSYYTTRNYTYVSGDMKNVW